MGKTKATLDTNILISALGWAGNPYKVFEKAVRGEIELIISEELFYELVEALEYPKLHFTEEQKDRFKSLQATHTCFPLKSSEK
ncbi:MAG: putative toxin-antitoxin system toxin component, PIN family [Candidatus Aenigmarchaeota archaeon]|nr:putative toxin-antitoxin system toxin component, PIN family [Candidatus Aenigmarchaeota archaeon]